MVIEISATAALTLAKTAAKVAKGPVLKLLARASHRRRLASATKRRAKRQGLRCSSKRLRDWLKSAAAQEQLERGTAEMVTRATEGLRGCARSGRFTTEEAAVVLQILLDQVLKMAPSSTAVATASSWTAQEVRASETRLQEHIQALPDQLAAALSHDYDDELALLHPMRRDAGRVALRAHRPLGSLLQALVSQPDREAVLSQWGASFPAELDSAPATAWTWLGEVASDYNAEEAAGVFFERGVAAGAFPKDYWLARAALAYSGLDPQLGRERVRAVLDSGGVSHPLGKAIQAEQAGDEAGLRAALTEWEPEDSGAAAIRTLALARVSQSAGELNAAIALAEEVAANRTSTGAALVAATLTLHRARTGASDNSVADASRALDLAIQARDGRRLWAGDSAKAVVVAVHAAAFLGDLGRAWSLTQLEGGEATAKEASDAAVRREAARFAALTGEHELAAKLAGELDDPYLAAVVEAMVAQEINDSDGAMKAWALAAQHAPDDEALLTTAMNLAEIGAALPDLEALEARHPDVVREVRLIHEVMSSSEDRIPILRARAPESVRLTMLLAKTYDERGEHGAAGDSLLAGGDRHGEPLLIHMAAKAFMRAQRYQDAQAAAEKALALGGEPWPGAAQARWVLHEALLAQGDTRGALVQAQALVGLSPDDPDARWNLAYDQMRRGDGAAAWRALTPNGVPISPRSQQEARLLVDLACDHDFGARFVTRVLGIASRWPDDADFQGSVLARMFVALAERDDDPEDGSLLREAAETYVQRWPNSGPFRSVALGPDNDPLAPLTSELAAQASAFEPILQRVRTGELPLGAFSMFGRSYAEAVVRRAAGMVRSFVADRAVEGESAVEEALTRGAILDTTALGTLASLPEATRHRLIGALARAETSEGAHRDALMAQAALGTRSRMSISYNSATQRPQVQELTEEEADLLAVRSATVADIAARLERLSRSAPSRLTEPGMSTDWLEAYEIAAGTGRVLWCDDAVLASMARDEGIVTFGTVDLLRKVFADERDHQLREVTEAVLVANWHVDLGFDSGVMRFAAGLDGWKARGCAFALSRPAAWDEPDAVGEFVVEALDHHLGHLGDLDELRNWVAAATVGVVRAAPDETHAELNARLMLDIAIARPGVDSAQLAQIVSGVRSGVSERAGTGDPVEWSLHELHKRLLATASHSTAARVLVSLVRQLPEDDRLLAARIVLEA